MPKNLYALLIAADCYLPNELPEGTYPSLRGCVPDVTRVETFLRERLGLTDDHLLKLTSTNRDTPEPPEPQAQWPTYDNIVTAFRELGRRASKGDSVYVHYSGHGGRVRPTLLPDVKGAGAYDESLVPIDVGNSSARYVRDIEMAKLLQELVGLGLAVTVVLDCCHSGGATRGIDAVARGVDFLIAQRPVPARSEVGTLDELRASWIMAVGGNGSRGLTTAAVAPGYTLLAACRQNEKANEFAFDGAQRNGALTYWMLDTLRPVGQDQTFKMLHDRILARVHAQFPTQTPVRLGDPGRGVFADVQIQPTVAALVLRAGGDRKRLILATGLAAGASDGAEYAIYPRIATDLSRPEGRTAVVRLIAVGDAESEAEVVEKFGIQPVEAGDRAVLLGAALTLRRRVRFVDREGKPAPEDDPMFLALRQALPGNGWVEPAGEAAADFAVRLSDGGRHYEIRSADGAVVPLRPDLPVTDTDSPARLIKRLVHLAKYRSWQELENKAPNATLQKRLRVELSALPVDFDPKHLPWPAGQPCGEPVPTLEVGQWIALRITNRAARAANVTVLDLQPDWGVSVAYPPKSHGQFETVDEDGGELVVPMKAVLPDGYDDGIDIVKVIAAYNPLELRALELPPLDTVLPTGRGATRAAGGDALERLLAAIDAPAPKTRTVAAFTSPGREWATAQFAIRVRRAKRESEGQP